MLYAILTCLGFWLGWELRQAMDDCEEDDYDAEP
jgi:hypothetical protein